MTQPGAPEHGSGTGASDAAASDATEIWGADPWAPESGAAASDAAPSEAATSDAVANEATETRVPESGDLVPGHLGEIIEVSKDAPMTGFDFTASMDPPDVDDPPSERLKELVLPSRRQAGSGVGRAAPEPTLRERLGPPDFKGAASETDPRGVVVWFATDRRRAPSAIVGFTGERAPIEKGRLPTSYGTAYVTLPPRHRTGQIEQRRFWQVLADPADARRFVVFHPPQLLSGDRFFDDVTLHVNDSPEKDVLVFVHGYNVSFDDGLKRLAQIAIDLGFQGAPVLFSWPSENRTRNYEIDAANIRWTAPHLERFLVDVVERTRAQRIYLLAHSLGNDALTSVLQLLRRSLGDTVTPLFRHVVLAAPDVDADTFEVMATEIVLLAHLVTLYASATDKALRVSGSRLVHGYPRAGQITGGLVVVPPMETIDATGIDSSFLKHSYFGGTDPLLADIHALLFSDKRADDRYALVHSDTDSRGRFWQFAPRGR